MNNFMFQIKSRYFAEIIQKFVSNHYLKYEAGKNNYSFKVGRSLYFVTINYGLITLSRDDSSFVEVYDFNDYNENEQVIFSHYALNKDKNDGLYCNCTKFSKQNGSFVLTSNKANMCLEWPSSEDTLVANFMFAVSDNIENTLKEINNETNITYEINDSKEYILKPGEDVFVSLYSLELNDDVRKR